MAFGLTTCHLKEYLQLTYRKKTQFPSLFMLHGNRINIYIYIKLVAMQQ